MKGSAAHGFLSTKIFRPPRPADCVPRPELLELLDLGRSRPLALVSAPAGYGKSTLVSNWLEANDWPSFWVSLDEDDSNLQRFLSYLTAAVCERFPQALETSRNLSHATDLPETPSVARILSNELNAIDRPFFLVLDDYHRIHAGSPVNDVLRILLDHPPIPLHLVLVTRRDPPLPLGRLRVLGQVTEVRMQDLRFNASQTADFFENVAEVSASADAVANLERELEGWVAGLRLMTLALRDVSDPDAFLRSFRGGTQHMQEYLISEVMAGLPKITRTWLLRSAILDRLCAPLCEAVCGTPDAEQTDAYSGEEFLAQLKSANLFLVPLDGYGRWFRFHHLFQNILQTELARHLDAKATATLHMRASQWLEENGLVEDAMRSALKADDWNFAADIFERHRLDELEQLNWHTVDRWLKGLARPGQIGRRCSLRRLLLPSDVSEGKE